MQHNIRGNVLVEFLWCFYLLIQPHHQGIPNVNFTKGKNIGSGIALFLSHVTHLVENN